MELLQSLTLGVLPGVFWLCYLRSKDDHEPEPWLQVMLIFAFGGASTFAVLWARPWFEDLLPWGTGWDRALADAFLLTAPLEEFVKMAAFLIGVAWHDELDEPLDGIIYGTAAGLGFASAETVHYVLREDSMMLQLEVAGIRAFTATLVHVTTTGALGFCFGLVRFTEGVKRPLLVIGGVGIAISLHGLYDVFLFAGGNVVWVSLLGVLPAMLLFLSMKIHWARAQSERFHA